MKIIVESQTPTKETLKTIYDICNKIFTNESCFYSKDEVKGLKKEKENIFL